MITLSKNRIHIILFSLIFLFLLNGFTNRNIIKDYAYDVTIYRDTWGVPHIYGETDADAAFGLAYAHSEDDYQTIEEVILSLRGESASINGYKYAPIDYLVGLLKIWDTIENKYEEQVSEEIKLLCKAYSDGINRYIEKNNIKSDIYPANGKDVIAGFLFRTPLMFEFDWYLKELTKPEKPSFDKFASRTDTYSMYGSNTIAIAPERSTDGYTRITTNSHQPWDGPVSWYEAHLVSEEGWDFYGALFPGSPVPLIGHNTDIGWSHTVNEPDLIDVYKLTTNKLNKNQYWFEGYWKDLEVRTVDIKVKIVGPFSWTFKRTVKSSIHGPVLEFDHGSYAIRISSVKDLRFLEQWYRMGKSKNISEFKEAMKIHAIPMFNTGYADRDGKLYYVYNAKIPKRDPRYNWKKILPGESKQTLWYEYIPFDKLPQVYDPLEGFYQNCNSSPYLATGSRVDASKPLPDWTGIEKHQTNRALRSLETFGVDPAITREEFFEYKFDVEYSRESILAGVRDRYVSEMDKKGIPEELVSAIDLIRKWNLRADSMNTSAAISILTLPNAFKLEDLKYDRDSVTIKLRETISYLKKQHEKIDVPLGRVVRLIRGKTSLPLSGGPGTLRAIYSKKEGKTYKAVAGDCYIQAVEWGPEGQLNAWSIHQYGSATRNEDSPHFDDQSKSFSNHELKVIRP